MDSGIAAIIVGAISTVGAIIVAMIHAGRKENKKDHAEVQATLFRIAKGIGRVDAKLDKHIDDHEKELWHGEITRRDP
jgi:hypothetical protein